MWLYSVEHQSIFDQHSIKSLIIVSIWVNINTTLVFTLVSFDF